MKTIIFIFALFAICSCNSRDIKKHVEPVDNCLKVVIVSF